MTKPGSKLIDVLHLNSKETLERHSRELAEVASHIPADLIQTRFLRNNFLISPKSLFLLHQTPRTNYTNVNFTKWNLFGIYKPPFCPMKAAEAGDNYHKVSVESFLQASLQSAALGDLMNKKFAPGCTHPPKIRVLNSISKFGSGPVLVSVSDEHSFSTSLEPMQQTYEVLVYGHLPVDGKHDIAVEDLFHPPSDDNGSEPKPTLKVLSSTKCSYEVKSNVYYAVHAVSLVEIHVHSPPTASPPFIESFVYRHLHTFVVGDPQTMGDVLAKQGSGADSSDTPTVKGLAMRGDLDFPRVFNHLREVTLTAEERDDRNQPTGAKTEIKFECKKCFDSVLEKKLLHTLKKKKMKILDGSWTPESEFI
ncbi:hypothetical protein AGDE_08041 [Angomonas deanei]|nr:hypothetical protein AGDE_08041 [Angomonas deanei]|eukprot:EPY34051.1 hypothetical protein AGDE_08041 [Angomonas deanei]